MWTICNVFPRSAVGINISLDSLDQSAAKPKMVVMRRLHAFSRCCRCRYLFGVLIGSFDFLDQSDAKPKDDGHEVVAPSIFVGKMEH